MECPVCFQKFSVNILQSHVNSCLDGSFHSELSNELQIVGPSRPSKINSNPGSTVQKSITSFFGLLQTAAVSINGNRGRNSVSNVESFTSKMPSNSIEITSLKRERSVTSKPETTQLNKKSRSQVTVVEAKEVKLVRKSASDATIMDKVETTSKGVKQCPWYKRIPGTNFSVDAFAYGQISNCTSYFLSHFHSDHYGGLTSKFNHGKIYCSEVTANLVIQQLRVDPNVIIRLPMESPLLVDDVTVTLIDANHCPGAVLILFETPTFRYLHTGDFRADFKHLEHPLLQQKIDILYLDTTYCDPKYTFPKQSQVINAVCEFTTRIRNGESVYDICGKKKSSKLGFEEKGERAGMLKFLSGGNDEVKWKIAMKRKVKKCLFLIGTYSIGKEKVFVGIAKAYGSKVFAETTKRRILSCLMDPEIDSLITSNPNDADVHVVSMGKLNKESITEKLKSLSSTYNAVCVFKPTGWTHKPSSPSNEISASSLHPTYLDFSNYGKDGPDVVAVFGVPYSEHSSYTELKEFIIGMNVGKIIPTVGCENADGRQRMEREFRLWENERTSN